MTDNSEQLKYPIGRFKEQPESLKEFSSAIERIADLPAKLKAAVSGLSYEQLNTAYRDGGWTLRQVVHHLPDSHMNAYVRFKLALTEDNPAIRPYNEGAWAECEEAKNGDIQVSLDLLDSLHKRWISFLRTLKDEDFERTYFHPANNNEVKLKDVVSMYAWHGDHHLAHITTTIERNKWHQE
jgi:hypothetical protein